MKPASI